jgi:hypothetical protein
MSTEMTLSSYRGRLSAMSSSDRNARDANADFFHQGNLVLIGSRRSNPWVEVYEPNLNFGLDLDPHSGAPLFRNRSPLSAESQVYAIPAAYDTQKVNERSYASYGVIALLRECGGNGLIILLEGLNIQATQAMGDLVTDPNGSTNCSRV